MAREKNRPEVALKLLEIYHARKSPTAFENVAKELHGMVDESSPQWQKAAAMGHQIDPANGLYAAAAASGATYTPETPAAKPDVDFAADTSGGSAPSTDFDLDAGSSTPAPDLPAEPAHTMDFNLENSNISSPTSSVDVPAAEAPKEEKSGFDFDLSGLDFPGSKSSSSEPAAAPASSGGSDLNLTDLSLDSPGGGEEAAGTKLELAKAYLEIGDKDGARDILNEVAKEGSSAQKEEAKKLISSL
jgi:pilus assembly protein FimV